jgi:outer membrane protein assembly factor BamB
MPISLAVSLLACGGGYCAVLVGPYLKTALPLWASGYVWKVNVRAKPLADYSLSAELDRMVIDDHFVFVRVDSRHHQWKAVDKERRSVIDVNPDVLGFVRPEDAAGAWEVSKTPAGLMCGRFASGHRQTVSLVVTDETIFFPQESAHVILGADPSLARLFAFRAATGEVLWDVRVPPEFCERIGSLVVNRNMVVAGLWGSKISAVSVTDGRTLWHFEEQGCGNPMYVVTTDDLVFGFSRLNRAYALEAATGRLKWSKNLEFKRPLRAYPDTHGAL